MKKPKLTSKSAPPNHPADSKQFPLKTQTPLAANRDKVREVVPVHAPRQSQRPVERSK
ncbi:MAG: hypothetical protein SGI99_02745 [Pseudomonadota bacterium]|nr:hypothetical protein [Pseudomonadota bacterium]